MIPKNKYRRRKARRMVSNFIWSVIMTVVVLIGIAIFGKNCAEYSMFMNREGLPGREEYQ